MHRLFVALRPPPPIRDLLIDQMDGIDDARWQDDDQLHITLRYIGEVDSRMAEDVATALSTIRADLPPLRIQGCGMFDSKGHPNAIWAGVAPRDPLAALHRKIDRALVRIFEVIHRDEPSHWAPYDGWLKAHGKRDPRWWERAVDGFIHSELLFFKLPVLFLNPWLRRRDDWADAGEAAAGAV